MEERGARIRDHLANERTMLAWVRTGLAMMAVGVVIARLRFELGTGGLRPAHILSAVTLGAVFIVVGLLTVLATAWIYTRNARAIDAATYQPIKAIPMVLIASILLLGLLSLLYVLGLLGRMGD